MSADVTARASDDPTNLEPSAVPTAPAPRVRTALDRPAAITAPSRPRTDRNGVPRRRASAKAPVTHDQIALRAYELHLAGTDGDAMAHWLRAERELVGA